jgi:hypothetical protein
MSTLDVRPTQSSASRATNVSAWSSVVRVAAVFFVYAALAAVATWPLLRDMRTHIASDAGDPILNTSILVWNATTMPYSSAWWTAPHFYPTIGTTTFTENLLGIYPIASPVYWLSRNPLLAYNLSLFLTWPLAAVSVFLLVRFLTGRADAAFVSGLAFAFTPYRAVSLGHIQTVAAFGVPLALLGLHGYRREGRWPWLVLFGLAWLQQGLANGYYILYGGLFFGLWLLYFCSTRDALRRGGAIVAAWAIASLPLVPILLRYRQVHNDMGLHRTLFEILYFSASPRSWFEVASSVWLWGRWLPEGKDNMFPGLAAVVLLVAGLGVLLLRHDPRGMRATTTVRWIRRVLGAVVAMSVAATVLTLRYGPIDTYVGPFALRIRGLDRSVAELLLAGVPLLLLIPRTRAALLRRSPLVFYALGIALFGLLACGPNLRVGDASIWNPTPYGWLMQLPGFNELRVPTQIKMFQLLCLMVATGLSFVVLAPMRGRRAAALTMLAVVAVLLDGWTTETPMAAAPTPWPVAEPAGRPEPILELPLGPDFDAAATFRAALHRRRMVNGVSGYDPPYYEALKEGLGHFDPATLRALATIGPYDIVVDGEKDPEGALDRYASTAPGATLAVVDGRRRVYRVQAAQPAAPLGAVVPIRDVQAVRHPVDVPRLLDGRLETFWADNPQEPDEWLVLDLGEPREVAGVTNSVGDAGREFPRRVGIDVSLDGTEWTEAWTGPGFAPAILAFVEAPLDARLRFPFPPRRARFVRMRQLDAVAARWRVSEISVHAPSGR